MAVGQVMHLLFLLCAVLEGRTCSTTEEVRTRVMVGETARTKANVVYLLQTHTRPAQVARLVQVITESSPDAVVLISHDEAGPALDVGGLRALGNVHVVLEHGGYGDFTHVDRYLAAVDWLDANGIDYDWLENLTGQDYPLRPIAEIEGTPVTAEVYEEMCRSYDTGVAEFLDLSYVKPNILGNSRMLLMLNGP